MRPGDDMAPLRALFTELLGLDQVSAHLGDMISAQETAYRAAPGSPWQGRFLPNLALEAEGEETCVAALLHTGRPVVLLFPDADPRLAGTAGAWSRTVDVVQVRCAHRLPWDALLLRPDGYVAWTPYRAGAPPRRTCAGRCASGSASPWPGAAARRRVRARGTPGPGLSGVRGVPRPGLPAHRQRHGRRSSVPWSQGSAAGSASRVRPGTPGRAG
ncbi:hypothetical protein [Streptomyces sp. C8S0]|uniref:aromatic-ring hydroxylase C-terminal domain-containing protein n=1 Tax=Streptomyces sp. C8S0 TaxID=2585716 RepID=UPI001D0432AB|nr:hypothetical protein [Streptomyces sp. C8S0]